MEIIIIDGIKYKRISNGRLRKVFEKTKIISGVYSITDLENGKVYVGSSKNVRGRISAHKSDSVPNSIMSRVCDKNKIEFNIIEECCEPVLRYRENFWVKKLNTQNPNGYNMYNPVTRERYIKYERKATIINPNNTY